MRKTSQDGEYPATSAVENEVRKPKGLLSELKIKKIGKRTAPNLSEESDDAVVEPLLQKSTNSAVQSAKYFAKAKAETVKEITKLFNDKKTQHASTSGFGTTESLLSEKDQEYTKSNVSNVPQHNHMNTNVFHSLDNAKANGTTKTQVLIEIDGSKQSGFNTSPLIFTTAKIHTDGKPNHMEPVQMTPAPIISTVEVSVSKGNIISNEKRISNGSSVIDISFGKPETAENTTNFSTTVKAQNSVSKSDNNKMTTATNKPNKTQLNYPLKTDSLPSTSKLIAANVNITVPTNSKGNNEILSETSISEIQKSNIVEQTKKFPLEEIKAVESSAQLPFISQTHKKEKPNAIDLDSKLTDKERESKEREAKTSIAINIKPIVTEKQTSSSTKPLERQKNITAAEDLLKIETEMASSKIPDHHPLLPVVESSMRRDTSKNASLNTNPKADISDLIVAKTHVITPKTTTTVTNTINSNANKVQAKTTKTVSSTTDTASSSTDKTKAITTITPTSISDKTSLNTNKTQAVIATSVADKPSLKADKTQTLPTKSPTSIPDKASSNANKTQAITSKVATAIPDKASTNVNKFQAVTVTSGADESSSKADKTQTLPTKAPTSIPDKASTNANKSQAVTATSGADKSSSKADKTQTLPTKAPTSIPDKASSNANKTQAITSKVATAIPDKASTNANKSQAVTATSVADKSSSKADKTQTLPTKAPTLIPDKASTNANKPQAVTAASIADIANSKAEKTQTKHTKTSISDEARSNDRKTQIATSADKTGSNINKSQIVTTKAATSTGDPTSSKAKPSPTSNTKPTSTKTSSKPISVSTVAKTLTNKSPSTPSAKIAQVTSPGSTTAKPLVGKTTQVSTSTTKPTGITSLSAVPAEHSNKTKTSESSNKDVKVTKA